MQTQFIRLPLVNGESILLNVADIIWAKKHTDFSIHLHVEREANYLNVPLTEADFEAGLTRLNESGAAVLSLVEPTEIKSPTPVNAYVQDNRWALFDARTDQKLTWIGEIVTADELLAYCQTNGLQIANIADLLNAYYLNAHKY